MKKSFKCNNSLIVLLIAILVFSSFSNLSVNNEEDMPIERNIPIQEDIS